MLRYECKKIDPGKYKHVWVGETAQGHVLYSSYTTSSHDSDSLQDKECKHSLKQIAKERGWELSYT